MKLSDKTYTQTVRSNNVETESEKYHYELIMKKSKRVTSYRLPLYSIKIHMTDSLGNVTEAEAQDLFSDIGKAIVFYQMLVDNLVTPIDLPYVVDDTLYV